MGIKKILLIVGAVAASVAALRTERGKQTVQKVAPVAYAIPGEVSKRLRNH